jgi:hypothetical protein
MAPPEPAAPRPGPFCLAVLLSLALHGGLALSLALVPAAEHPAPRPVDVEWAVLGDDRPPPPLSTASEPTSSPPGPVAGAGGTEEQGGGAVLVDPPDYPIEALRGQSTTAASDPDGTPRVLPRGSSPAMPRSAGPGSGGSGTSPGGEVPGGLLDVPPAARSVVYLLDRSLSMGESDALARARGELIASLRRLPPATRFQVIPYNRQAEPLRVLGQVGLLPADEDAVREAERQVTALPASGSTDHARALLRGLALRPDVLFLLTDADDLSDRDVRDVTLRNQGRTAIHAVELSRRAGRADSPLRRLAAANRGTYRCVPPGGE